MRDVLAEDLKELPDIYRINLGVVDLQIVERTNS
jgi:hypothetical protein